jgi:nucleoside-diphosphate-sugar epimerase
MIATARHRSPLAADLDHILDHTQDLWEGLRGQAVFITGGTGFFGRWLLESFAEANHRFSLGAQAVVLTRNPESFRRRNDRLANDEFIQLVKGDVQMLNADLVQSQLGSATPERFSHFIHAASETTETANRNDPTKVLETSLIGTRRALDFAGRMGAENFLLTSSGAVYGPQPHDLSHVPENYSGAPDISAPLSAYGEGKRVAELLCNARTQSGAMNCKIARCFAFVGPHLALDAHYAIGNFIRDALAEKEILVSGDGTPVRSYLYSADLAVWLWTILLNPAATGTYNVGSSQAHSIREIAKYVSQNSSAQPPIQVTQTARPNSPATRYVPDIGRAQRELGLQVWTPLDAAIRKTFQFHNSTTTSI